MRSRPMRRTARARSTISSACIECAHNAGVQTLCGPYYQVLGQFTGKYPERGLN